MEKRQGRRAFWVAFVAMLFCLSVMEMAAVLWTRPQRLGEGTLRPQTEEGPLQAVLLPQKEDRLEVVVLSGDGERAEHILLAQLDPVGGAVRLAALPGTVRLQPEGKSLGERYALDGVDGVYQELGAALGWRPQRWAYFDESALAKAVDLVGAVRFAVPWREEIRQGSVTVQLEAGEQLLTGSQAEALLRSPNQPGEVERYGMLTEFAAAAVDQYFALAPTEAGRQLFEAVWNLGKSDLGSFDWEQRRRSAEFLAQLDPHPAQAEELRWEDGVLEEASRQALRAWRPDGEEADGE